MHHLLVSTPLHCVSSPARRKTFTFTAISATLSRLTPRKILPTIPEVHRKNFIEFPHRNCRKTHIYHGTGIHITSIFQVQMVVDARKKNKAVIHYECKIAYPLSVHFVRLSLKCGHLSTIMCSFSNSNMGMSA